jgi:hypothetical protein
MLQNSRTSGRHLVGAGKDHPGGGRLSCLRSRRS